MATTGAALPIERVYLVRAWFVVAAVVIAATLAISLAAASRTAPAGGTEPEPVKDFGPVTVQNDPILVNGDVCGQCR